MLNYYFIIKEISRNWDIPRVLMVGERLTGTKELLFFDGRRGYRTDLDWYFDKSLAAA
jgi:hypothetical protein